MFSIPLPFPRKLFCNSLLLHTDIQTIYRALKRGQCLIHLDDHVHHRYQRRYKSKKPYRNFPSHKFPPQIYIKCFLRYPDDILQHRSILRPTVLCQCSKKGCLKTETAFLIYIDSIKFLSFSARIAKSWGLN